MEWWNRLPKEVVLDQDEYAKTTIGIVKLKGEENVYEMWCKSRHRVGIIRPWIDKEGKYPPQFKNEDNVVTPFGVPEYEYIFDKDQQAFHDMPRSTYHKYTFSKVFEKFIPSDEIREFKDDERHISLSIIYHYPLPSIF